MIITTINQIKQYTDTTIGVNLHSLLPLIPGVIRQHIAPFVPATLIQKLESMEEPLADDDDIYTALLYKLRAVISNFLVASYVPRSEASLAQTGLQRTEGSEQKSAYRYQSAAFVKSYTIAGLDALDDLLATCAQHSSDIEEWHSSSEKELYDNLLIKNGVALRRYITLKHPHITYQQIATDMEDVEQIMFYKLWGNNYTALKERIKAEVLTDNEKMLLKVLQKTLAYMSLTRALPRLNFTIDTDGLLAVRADDQYDKQSASNSDFQLEQWNKSMTSTAMEYLDKAKLIFETIILQNPDDAYASNPVHSPTSKIDNSKYKGSFML